MEKPIVPQRSRSRISQIAAQAAISFRNLPFSPGRAHHHHHNKGFSGPLIPKEARGRSSNIEADQEPTSPRVSCIGQIKQKRNKCKLLKKPKQHVSETKGQSGPEKLPRPGVGGHTGPITEFKKIFGVGRKSYAASDRKDDYEEAPSLGQIRKFASSRDALADFDWTSVRDEKAEKSNYDDGGDVIIPFSGPIFSDRPRDNVDPTSARLEVKKKEISLWKRRTMAQPKPLQLNMV